MRYFYLCVSVFCNDPPINIMCILYEHVYEMDRNCFWLFRVHTCSKYNHFFLLIHGDQTNHVRFWSGAMRNICLSKYVKVRLVHLFMLIIMCNVLFFWCCCSCLRARPCKYILTSPKAKVTPSVVALSLPPSVVDLRTGERRGKSSRKKHT